MAMIRETWQFDPRTIERYPFPDDSWRDTGDERPLYHAVERIHESNIPPGGIQGVVIFLHGSGATVPIPSITARALTQAGFIVHAVVDLGYLPLLIGLGKGSSESPNKFAYGATANPMFTARGIKSAFWVEAAVQSYLNSQDAHLPMVIWGHSLGAQAALAWAAGYADYYTPPPSNYRGMLADGCTGGSLGDGSFNSPYRLISTLSNMIALKRVPGPLVMAYGDHDASAPPDLARRLQVLADQDTYFVTPGPYGHQWFQESSDRANIGVAWCSQIINRQPILTASGQLALPGPNRRG